MSLELLLSKHTATLSALYSSLSPTPSPLLAASISELEQSITNTISSQLATVQAEITSVEESLTASWKKVSDWRCALGEAEGRGRGEGPLLLLVKEVEGILAGMRSKMEARGVAIITLQEKLHTMRELLGSEWLVVELEDISAGWEGLDLRLERMNNLMRECSRCETELASRREYINVNAQEIFDMRTELGINSSTPYSGARSAETVNAPLPDSFDEMILCHLGVGDSRQKKELVPTAENLEMLEAKRKWLLEEQEHRNSLIQFTYDRLDPLWRMLGVTDAEAEEFTNTHVGSTAASVSAYQNELTRMLQLKRSNLSAFILSEREALTILWDTLYLAPQQRLHSFPSYQVDVLPSIIYNPATGLNEEIVNENVSEELLVAHEKEKERLELVVQEARPVLERLEKYFSVVEEMRELEASAADPSRLTGKSTRGDPGRLLREEKARKRVIKDKPKLEAELRSLIPSWEHENGRPFLINGKRFIDDLDEKIEAEAAEKEAKKRAKLGGPSSSSTTRTVPLRAQMTGNQNRAVPLRAQNTGGSNLLPIKRQMTGSSTPSARGAPVAKKLIPSATGSTGEVKGKMLERSSSNASWSSSQGSQSASQGSVFKEVGNKVTTSGLSASASGMRIPSGWGGGGAEVKVEEIDIKMEEQGLNQFGDSTSRGSGGFRPRTSVMSSSGGSVLGR